MSNEDKVSNETKSKKKVFIPITLAIFIIILLGLGTTFLFLSNKTDKIITNIINTLYDDYKTTRENRNTINLEEQPFIIDGNLKLETNIPELVDLNKEQINYKLGIDYQNEKAFGDFSLIEDNNKLLSIIYYFLNNEAYIKFDEYDKLIKIESNDLFSNENTEESINFNTEDFDYIVKEFKDILIKSLNMKAFTKETTTLKIYDKDEKVNKLTLPVTAENLKELDEKLSKNILKNEELLNKISETFNIDIEELKSDLNEEYNEYEDLGTISIYTKPVTNKLKMIEYSNDETKIEITFEDTIDKITITSGILNIEFDIKENTEEKINIDYQINYGVTINGNLQVETKNINEEKYETNINLSIKYLNYDLTLKGNYNIELKEDLFDIDTNNAVNQDEVNPNEFNQVMENIMTKLQNSNLFKLLNGFTGETNPLI